MRSLETRSNGCNSNNLDGGESRDNIISSPDSTPPLSLSPLAPVFSPTHWIVEGTEVVNDGELIITNFIDNDKADYSKIAFTVLTTLKPSITSLDITLARPLPVPPKNSEQSNRSSRIAVLLSSCSIVSKVSLAKSKRTRLSTDDLNISLLGVELSKYVKHCKIFINEALSKDRFKLFRNLKSAAKNLGIKYVWHRGGKFMNRVRRGG